MIYRKCVGTVEPRMKTISVNKTKNVGANARSYVDPLS